MLCNPLNANQERTIWKNFEAFIFSLLRRLMESCRKVRNQGEVKIYTCRFIDDIKKRQKENQMIESDLYQ